jgi:[lysine-biosynthesis-protein LysW]--L-2-aminoadipate ligase
MQKSPHIGVLFSRVRVEEKWIFNALEERGVDYERLDDRAISFDLQNPQPWQKFDAVLERSISYNNGLYALRILNTFGIPTVNKASVAEICGDKLVTSTHLALAGIPQPRVAIAFTQESALQEIEAFGYRSSSNR